MLYNIFYLFHFYLIIIDLKKIIEYLNSSKLSLTLYLAFEPNLISLNQIKYFSDDNVDIIEIEKSS